MIIEMKADHLKDINKPNEPFMVVGRIILKYENDTWTFTELFYEEQYLKSYPNDDKNYADYIDNDDKVVFLYYQNNECVGKIILRRNWNKYAFVEYIEVCKNIL